MKKASDFSFGITKGSGFGSISLNGINKPYKLKAILSIPPITITDAISQSPQSITVYGNTVNGIGVGDRTINLLTGWQNNLQAHATTGVITYSNMTCITGYIPVDFTLYENYTISCSSGYSCWICAYDENKNYLGRTYGGITHRVISAKSVVETVNQGSSAQPAYLIFCYNTTDYNNIINNTMFIAGSYTQSSMPGFEKYGYKLPIYYNGAFSYNLYTESPIYNNKKISFREDLEKLAKGTNIIDVDTTIKPAAIEILYLSR